MDSKRFVIGTVGGAIILYATGWVIFSYLLGDFYAANVGHATGVDRAIPIQWPQIIGNLTYGALITYVLGHGVGRWTLADGAKVGAVVGCLIWATSDFTLYGVSDVANLKRTLVDPALELIHGAIGGVSIATLTGLLVKERPSTSA